MGTGSYAGQGDQQGTGQACTSNCISRQELLGWKCPSAVPQGLLQLFPQPGYHCGTAQPYGCADPAGATETFQLRQELYLQLNSQL